MDSNATETLNKPFLNPTLEQHATRTTTMGFKTIGGDILQVPGRGLVVRSTARKDRHSKVYTARGLRDRRVRLSAHTAIQFYDVQDRLGYDRPSKAVDWLIKKAKSAIDKLSDFPPCNPNACSSVPETDPIGIEVVTERSESSKNHDFLFQSQFSENLIPPPPPVESAVGFQSYQNLGLSLQTQNSHQNVHHNHHHHQTVFYTASSGNSGQGFDDGFEKIVAWNSNVFGSIPIFNQSSTAFPHRGPLQSSLESPVPHYTWNDLSVVSAEKRHPCPIHEHSSPSISRFISDGLPHLDVHGRFQSDGDGDGGKASPHSSSYSRR